MISIPLPVQDIDNRGGTVSRGLRTVLDFVEWSQIGYHKARGVGKDFKTLRPVVQRLLRGDHIQRGLAGEVVRRLEIVSWEA